MLTDESDIKDINNLNIKVGVLETSIDDMKESVKEMTSSINTCLHGCGLDPYKAEMKQRCELFSEKIQNNKEMTALQKREIEKMVEDVEDGVEEKIKSLRHLISRIITTVVVVGIFFGGIIGTIQIQKVSQSEYNNHLSMYQDNRSEQINRFDKFLDVYAANIEKRDIKIDSILQHQQDFNEAISRRNILLEGQLNLIKQKIELDN